MILSDVFERFARDAPLSVMAQGIMENVLNPQILDQLFEDVAQRQFTHKLLFSTPVDLMSVVVCRIRPSIHAAFQARAETVGATIDAVYDKLDGTETVVSATLVHAVADRLAPVIDAMNGAREEWLPGYRVRILDGNHLPGSEHRIKELRTIRAGAWPGPALVVLDPQRMLATDVVLCEDGHAQERSLLDQILAKVAAKDLWIADRNFCTTDFLFGIAGRGGSFVIRQHASTLRWTFVGKRRACGRIDTGKVFEQTIRATNDAGEILFLRRVTVLLDPPSLDHRDSVPRIGGNAPRRGQHLGISQGGALRLLRGSGVVQRAEHNQGGVAFCAWRGRGRRAGLWLLRGRRDPDDAPRDDDCDPGGRMGGVSRPAPCGVGQGLGESGAVDLPTEAAQASARSEEAEAQEAERGEDQTRRHREDPKSSSNVYEMTPPKGWDGGGDGPELRGGPALAEPAGARGSGPGCGQDPHLPASTEGAEGPAALEGIAPSYQEKKVLGVTRRACPIEHGVQIEHAHSMTDRDHVARATVLSFN